MEYLSHMPDTDTSEKHISRRGVIRVAGASGTAVLAGCTDQLTGNPGADTDRGGGSRTITDGTGRDVSLPAEIERVICIGAGTLRQVAYMKAADRVVGVEEGEKTFMTRSPYNMANPGLRDLPTVGPSGPNASGNAEQILAQNPDVIFYIARGDPNPAEELSDQTDTPVVILNITHFGTESERETIYDTWELLGEVLNKADRATELVETTNAYLADLESRSADRAEPERNAYVGGISYKGAHGINWTRNPYPPFEFTHTNNVVEKAESGTPFQVAVEKLIEWDPPTAFVDSGNVELVKQSIEENSALRNVSAIENEEVYKILPSVMYHSIYTNVIANAYYVGKTVYSDDYSELSIQPKTNEIYQRYLGASLYEDTNSIYSMFEPMSIPE